MPHTEEKVAHQAVLPVANRSVCCVGPEKLWLKQMGKWEAETVQAM